MENCLFCKMNQGQIPVERVFEDDLSFVIRDIQPQAKVHFLVIPKIHVATLADLFPEQGMSQEELLGKLFSVATKVARNQHLMPDGFRMVINTNHHAGQTVHHLHLHLLGGEPLKGSFGR